MKFYWRENLFWCDWRVRNSMKNDVRRFSSLNFTRISKRLCTVVSRSLTLRLGGWDTTKAVNETHHFGICFSFFLCFCFEQPTKWRIFLLHRGVKFKGVWLLQVTAQANFNKLIKFWRSGEIFFRLRFQLTTSRHSKIINKTSFHRQFFVSSVAWV